MPTVPKINTVTEFCKMITHIGAREIIGIFMFSGSLIKAGRSFKIFQELSCNLRY